MSDGQERFLEYANKHREMSFLDLELRSNVVKRCGRRYQSRLSEPAGKVRYFSDNSPQNYPKAERRIMYMA
jgi:hypothetical protein